jgi:hypothetical protein
MNQTEIRAAIITASLLIFGGIGTAVATGGIGGCAAAPAIATGVVAVAPYIDGALCKLASEQGNEPGWEIFICNIIDPNGVPVQFKVKVPSGQAASFKAQHSAMALPRGSMR